jgi:hypothetical protein
LSGEGQVLLVDCGATSLVALKAQGLDPGAVDAVAVTSAPWYANHSPARYDPIRGPAPTSGSGA